MTKVREVDGLGEREEKMTKERGKEGGRATTSGKGRIAYLKQTHTKNIIHKPLVLRHCCPLVTIPPCAEEGPVGVM
jgi:hypothetical protein